MASRHVPHDRAAIKAAIRQILRKDANCAERAITMERLYVRSTGDYILPGKKYNQTRIVRSIIRELRMDDQVPVISNECGYYLAESEAELEPYLRAKLSELRGRFELYRRMSRMPIGQMLRQYDFLTTDDLEELSNAQGNHQD